MLQQNTHFLKISLYIEYFLKTRLFIYKESYLICIKLLKYNNGSINILRKHFKERNEKWLYHNSVRAFVNVPCQRVSPFAQAPSFRWCG